MNIMELLQLVDDRLRPMVGADESAVQALLAEVTAGPRPAGVAPNAESRAVLAGQLFGIEQECRMLRDLLHVELTFVSRASVETPVLGPTRPRPTPTDPNTPD